MLASDSCAPPWSVTSLTTAMQTFLSLMRPYAIRNRATCRLVNTSSFIHSADGTDMTPLPKNSLMVPNLSFDLSKASRNMSCRSAVSSCAIVTLSAGVSPFRNQPVVPFRIARMVAFSDAQIGHSTLSST